MCDTRYVIKVPRALTFEEACTLPILWCTTRLALGECMHLCGRNGLLIHATTGGVGLVALELSDAGIATRLRRAGVDQWPMSGKPKDICAAFKLDAKGLASRVMADLG